MNEKLLSEMIKTALEMRDRAYVPYSHFSVGAGLLGEDGKIYGGCNIENAAFTPGICAERTAFSKAVSEGVHKFTALAVAGGAQGKAPSDFCPPCGVCRQVLAEFCGPDFPIYLVKSENEVKKVSMKEILPLAFGPGMLEN